MPARAPLSPFLKWVGGKRQLLPHILRCVPPDVDTYYEPFVGGGAVFFALAADGRRFKRAVLGDANQELVLCYQAIRDDVDAVIRALRRRRYDHDEYYEVRALEPSKLGPARRAARLIYLNRCGYNGLYRVNSAGRFNVPFGRYRAPVICDAPRLKAASRALQGVDLVVQDFALTLERATPRDFVYLDPPYVPVSATSSFTAYARVPFNAGEQERLAETLRALGRRGVPALLSNSDCGVTRQLYRRLPLESVPVRRAINSNAARRGPVPELLVRSFAYGGARVLSNRDGEPRRAAETA